MAFALLALCLAWATPGRATEVQVAAAASLADALTEIGKQYQAGNGDKVTFNFGASSQLARQIEEGAPADLFFSADEAKMDQLAKAGLIVPDTRRSRLSNTLVIIVNAQGDLKLAAAQELAAPRFHRIALAEPATVPAGIYAKQYLATAGLWTAVEAKVVPTENVRAALATVGAGNADAGFVYKTDATVSTRVRIALEITAADGPRITYPLAVLKNAREPAAARRFADFLATPPARQIFEKFGFLWLPDSPRHDR